MKKTFTINLIMLFVISALAGFILSISYNADFAGRIKGYFEITE
ncbi:MAG: hypothetical protein R3A12_18730 [Ignavibacteria bacterium]